MTSKETNQIIKFLENSKVKYKVIIHQPIHTAEEAAKVRKTLINAAVKSLIFKLDKNEFKLILVRGDKRANLKELKKLLNSKNIRLASPEEVLKLTGCEIGRCHPFGNLNNLEIIMDSSILENEIVDFNIGQHTHSCEMKTKDLVKLLKPKILEFTS